jgi:hypothetical protein
MRQLAPRREPFPRSLQYRLALTVVVGLLLVGCGKHYWSKPGAGPSDFLRESNECARENAVQVSSSKDYGIVIADLYKVCLKSRGWIRGQQFEPPPAGWFRGIEDDGPMRFEPLQPAPQPAAPAPAPQPQAPTPAPPQPPPTR